MGQNACFHSFLLAASHRIFLPIYVFSKNPTSEESPSLKALRMLHLVVDTDKNDYSSFFKEIKKENVREKFKPFECSQVSTPPGQLFHTLANLSDFQLWKVLSPMHPIQHLEMGLLMLLYDLTSSLFEANWGL